MNIGIIGAGHIGATLASLLTRAGHAVAISNSRGPETLRELVTVLGPTPRAVAQAETARFGEVVVEAVPFGRYADLPAEALKGKVLVTAANYYPERDGAIDLGGLSRSAFIAKQVPSARVVKAFNTIDWQHLKEQANKAKPLEFNSYRAQAEDGLEAELARPG